MPKEGPRALNGRAELLQKLAPLADAIARGDYEIADKEKGSPQLAEMIAQGTYIFYKLSDEEMLGVRHTNKPNVTYLASFLYKHSQYPLSPYAALVAAQRYLHRSTRNRGKRKEEQWKNEWLDD